MPEDENLTWRVLTDIRARPLAEVGEEILAAGDPYAAPTLIVLSAIMRGLSDYLVARECGDTKANATEYGKEARFEAMHGISVGQYDLARDEERDFFGADAYKPRRRRGRAVSRWTR